VATGVQGYRLMARKSVMADAAAEQFINLQQTLRGLDETILTQGTPSAKDLARKSLLAFDQTWPKLMAANRDADLQAQLEASIHPAWKNFSAGVEAFLKIRAPGPDNDEAMLAFGKLIILADALSKDIANVRVRSAESAEAEVSRLSALGDSGHRAHVGRTAAGLFPDLPRRHDSGRPAAVGDRHDQCWP
jgi:hypothetical protein